MLNALIPSSMVQENRSRKIKVLNAFSVEARPLQPKWCYLEAWKCPRTADEKGEGEEIHTLANFGGKTEVLPQVAPNRTDLSFVVPRARVISTPETSRSCDHCGDLLLS